jgi:hypothetical protein
MLALKASSNGDVELVKLAREIAMDIQPLEIILKNYSITDQTWSELQRNRHFQQLVASETEAWTAALNTHERVKLKAASMMEEWLPELNGRLHDVTEALAAKIEGAKMLAKIANMGIPDALTGLGGERFVVTINLGPQTAPLEFTKDVTHKVIEGEVINTVKAHEGN